MGAPTNKAISNLMSAAESVLNDGPDAAASQKYTEAKGILSGLLGLGEQDDLFTELGNLGLSAEDKAAVGINWNQKEKAFYQRIDMDQARKRKAENDGQAKHTEIKRLYNVMREAETSSDYLEARAKLCDALWPQAAAAAGTALAEPHLCSEQDLQKRLKKVMSTPSSKVKNELTPTLPTPPLRAPAVDLRIEDRYRWKEQYEGVTPLNNHPLQDQIEAVVRARHDVNTAQTALEAAAADTGGAPPSPQSSVNSSAQQNPLVDDPERALQNAKENLKTAIRNELTAAEKQPALDTLTGATRHILAGGYAGAMNESPEKQRQNEENREIALAVLLGTYQDSARRWLVTKELLQNLQHQKDLVQYREQRRELCRLLGIQENGNMGDILDAVMEKQDELGQGDEKSPLKQLSEECERLSFEILAQKKEEDLDKAGIKAFAALEKKRKRLQKSIESIKIDIKDLKGRLDNEKNPSEYRKIQAELQTKEQQLIKALKADKKTFYRGLALTYVCLGLPGVVALGGGMLLFKAMSSLHNWLGKSNTRKAHTLVQNLTMLQEASFSELVGIMSKANGDSEMLLKFQKATGTAGSRYFFGQIANWLRGEHVAGNQLDRQRIALALNSLSESEQTALFKSALSKPQPPLTDHPKPIMDLRAELDLNSPQSIQTYRKALKNLPLKKSSQANPQGGDGSPLTSKQKKDALNELERLELQMAYVNAVDQEVKKNPANFSEVQKLATEWRRENSGVIKTSSPRNMEAEVEEQQQQEAAAMRQQQQAAADSRGASATAQPQPGSMWQQAGMRKNEGMNLPAGLKEGMNPPAGNERNPVGSNDLDTLLAQRREASSLAAL